MSDEIQMDDELLRQEGLETLSLSELAFACKARGLQADYGNADDLKEKLDQWLSLYTVIQQPTQWMILHAPVLI